jgi:hypothetical protein
MRKVAAVVIHQQHGSRSTSWSDIHSVGDLPGICMREHVAAKVPEM